MADLEDGNGVFSVFSDPAAILNFIQGIRYGIHATRYLCRVDPCIGGMFCPTGPANHTCP
jgi:hypothetical protein